MKCVVDENVSYAVVEALMAMNHSVISIAKEYPSISDKEVYEKVLQEKAILITRDYHFTNPISYPPEHTAGVIYIRPGNITVTEEVRIVLKFFGENHPENIQGSLVTLYKHSIKIRPPKKR